ncbi:hypothetical protein ES707_20654 [subsurface metagenome]
MRLVKPDYATLYGDKEEDYRNYDKYSWLKENEKPADFICGFDPIDGGVFSVYEIEDPTDRKFIRRIIAAVKKRAGSISPKGVAAIMIKREAISNNGLIVIEENSKTNISEVDTLHRNIKNATLSRISCLLDTFPGSIQNHIAFDKIDIQAAIKLL